MAPRFFALEQPGAQAEKGKGEEIIADDCGPVDGHAVADDIVQRAEDETGHSAPARAVAHGEKDDGQHGHVQQGPAVGQLAGQHVLQQVDDQGDGDHDRRFT